MKALLPRVKNILFRPRHEWRMIRDEPATYPGIIVHYVCILAVIPPAAAITGRAIFDRNIPNSALASSLGRLLISNALWYGAYILNVAMAGAIISAIVAIHESRWNGLQGLRLAAYSFTPLFIAGFFAAFPGMAGLSMVRSSTAPRSCISASQPWRESRRLRMPSLRSCPRPSSSAF